MSSFGVSASGTRGYTISQNEQATNVSTPSKVGDHAHVQLGGFQEVRIVLPLTARLERISNGGGSYMRIVVPSGDLTVFAEAAETGRWPHIFVNAGKHLNDYYRDEAGFEVAEVVHAEVGDLIPPTPEDPTS